MSIRKYQLFVFAFFLLAGCSPKVVKSTVSKSCKNQIQNFLSGKWFYDENKNIYLEKKGFRQLSKTSFAKEGCLQTLNRNDIIALFGKPSKEIENRLYYYYHKTCIDDHLKCPIFLEIKLNEEGYFESARTKLKTRVSH